MTMTTAGVGDASDPACTGGIAASVNDVEQRIARFIVPIKAEFLQNDTIDASATFFADNVAENDVEHPKKKRRGMSKDRNSRNRKNSKQCLESSGPKLCLDVFRGKNCGRGEQCKFSHDIDAYLKTKPADISERCHLFELNGSCRFGVMCRYAGAHLNDKNELIFEDRESKEDPVLNVAPFEVVKKVRQRQYPFPKSQIIAKDLKLFLKHQGKDSAVATEDVATLESNTFRSCDSGFVPLERRPLLFDDKLYLAPLTTVGNLPFRRLCKGFGVDITCGEMAMAHNILQGSRSEWALMKRHSSEDMFGVQLCGANPEVMAKVSELISSDSSFNVDFIDLNVGCPIDLVVKQGQGSGLMKRRTRLLQVTRAMSSASTLPITVKCRTGFDTGKNNAFELIPQLSAAGISALTIHGRSRQQRYTKQADWDYLNRCAAACQLENLPFVGNGDVYSFQDYYRHKEEMLPGACTSVMIGRAALIKPWLFTEIKECRDWDISAHERLEMLRRFVNFGLEHWGSDLRGVETVRRFLLEWLSFLCRYVPVGLLEHFSGPVQMNWRPPAFVGRSDLETLMGSQCADDWVRISEMLLGKAPEAFTFIPKHRSNAYILPADIPTLNIPSA